MHSDPHDFDSMPVGGAGARAAPMARRDFSGGAPSAAAAPPGAPKRQLIAEKLYKQQHTDDSYGRPATARKRGGLSGGGGPSSRPQLLMCYLCGQQFGTSSLHIHQPQCYVKKLLQWEKSPLVNRGPKPLSPDEFAAQSDHMDSPIMPGDAGAIDAFNNAQYKNYTDKMLVPCENCGRTFLPDRLPIHQRACKPGNAMRRVSASPARPVTAPRPERAAAASAAASRAIPEQPRGPTGELVPCENCGRTFLPDRLPVHQKACKPGNAMRRVSASPGRPSASSAAAKDRSPSPRMSEELGPTRRPRTSQPAAPTLRDMDASPASGGSGSNGPSSPPIRAKSGGLSRLAAGSSTSELVPCQFCKRTFAPARIEKHEGVCVERKTISTPAAGPSKAPRKAFPAVSAAGRHPSSSPARNVAPRVDSGLRPRSPQAAATREQHASSARAPVTPRGGGARSTGTAVGNPNSMLRNSPPPPSQSQRAQCRPAYDESATPPRSTSPSMAQLQASLDQISREIEQQKTADQSRTPRRSAVSPGYTPSTSPPPPHASAQAVESCSSSVGASGPTPVRPMVLPRPDAPDHDGGRSSSVQSLGNASSSAGARPKFCFECGSKVPVSTAKFCGECGMRL